MSINLVEVLIQTIIAIVCVVPMGTLHELIHAWKAKQLGYTVKSMNLRKNETIIDIQADDPNHEKIAKAPYYFMFPIGAIIIIAGYFLEVLGMIIGGIAILFLHLISFWLEGEDPYETHKSEPDNPV